MDIITRLVLEKHDRYITEYGDVKKLESINGWINNDGQWIDDSDLEVAAFIEIGTSDEEVEEIRKTAIEDREYKKALSFPTRHNVKTNFERLLKTEEGRDMIKKTLNHIESCINRLTDDLNRLDAEQEFFRRGLDESSL